MPSNPDDDVRGSPLTPTEIGFHLDCDTDDESEYAEITKMLHHPSSSFSSLSTLKGSSEQPELTSVHQERKSDNKSENDEEYEGDEGDDDDNDYDNDEKNSHENNEENEDDDISEDLQLFERVILCEPIQSKLFFKKRISKGVYLVERISDKQPLCLKFVRRKSRYQTRIPMELRILSQIKTFPQIRHLQKLEGFFLSTKYYAFLSEFVPDLMHTSSLHQRPLEVKAIMRQLLVGIRQLHRNGIIHRDIKMSNVLWSGKQLTIVDFDKATWNTPKGHHVLVGTEGFLSPEVWRYERDGSRTPAPYSEKCDIYSAGMLFGCLLFHVSESEVKEMHASIFRDDAKRYFPPATSDLLLQMLRFRPNKRPSAHTLLQHAYFAK